MSNGAIAVVRIAILAALILPLAIVISGPAAAQKNEKPLYENPATKTKKRRGIRVAQAKNIVHDAEHAVEGVWLGGVWAWCLNTFISAVVGFWWGLFVVGAVSALPIGDHGDDHDEADDHAAAH